MAGLHAALAALQAWPVMAQTQRNILFLMADQHRHDAMGGGAHTPHLDALAADGAQFLEHYTSTPSCTPARAAILTGLSPWRHGMLGYGVVAPKYSRELPREMMASGRWTAVIGKLHYGWNETLHKPIPHGFEFPQIYDGLGTGFANGTNFDDYDSWFQRERPGQNPLKSGGLNWNTWRGAPYEFDEYFHPTAWTGRLAVDTIRSLAKATTPFFLKVSFHRPHSPYDPPKRILEATKAPRRPPARAADGWDEQWRNCSNRGQADQCCGEVDDKASLQLARRAYLGGISFVDEQIGKIMEVLRETGLMNNTFVLYTSDHGDMQNDHYLWRKCQPYEGAAHIPLVLRWPESMDHEISAERGTKVRSVTELRDVFPTFLEVAGRWDEAAEAHFDGRPLTQLLRGASPLKPWRRWIDLEHNVFCSPNVHWSALTDGKVKFIFHAFTGERQLFNLTADPDETLDLAKRKGMRELVELWQSRMVAQFRREGRGSRWLTSDGSLARRREPCNYSPNYPLTVHNCTIVNWTPEKVQKASIFA